MRGYFRVRDHSQLPSLAETDLMMTMTALHGGEVRCQCQSCPDPDPAVYVGPPEFVHIDMKDTDKPGLVFVERGKGEVEWIPWDLGALDYRESYECTCRALPGRCQSSEFSPAVETTAHRLVEISWMKQDGRQLLHLINVSGHLRHRSFSACPMHDIKIRMAVNLQRSREPTLAAPSCHQGRRRLFGIHAASTLGL